VATIATSTQADVLSPPGVPSIVRQSVDGNGYLFAALRTAADTLTVYRSTNAGASWASFSSFTHTGLQEWSSLVADQVGYIHLAYRVGTGTLDTIWYRRLNTSNATWSAGLQTSGPDANSGSIGSRWQGVDLAVARNADTSYAIVVAGAYTEGTTKYGVLAMGVSIKPNGGTIYSNNGLISGNRSFTVAGTSPGRSGVTCEVEHTGDGYTSGTPNVWITWGRTSLKLVKLAWTAGTWRGPTGLVTIRSTIPSPTGEAVGRWDGTQFVMAIPSPDDATVVRIYQRDRANSKTLTYDSPALTTGTVKNIAVSYDNSTKNIRVYAMGTSTAVLYYVDYVRASQTWTAWSTVLATAVTGSTEWGVRRGGSTGNARHDVLTTAGSSSPYTVTHTAQAVSTAPAIAAFDTSAQAYTSGGPANAGAALPLAWTFSDQDPGQTQGSYALSRQIGAGAISYWNAGTSSWGASEVQNASATQGVTLASGWAADADALYAYKVKVWDSANVAAADYSAALVLNPSARVDPTVTAPTAGSTLTINTVTVTWTVAQQTGIRVVLAQTSPLTRPTVYDSGPLMGYTDTSFTVPLALDTATSWTVTLTTYNAEGLASTAVSKAFSVAYSPPPAIVATVVPQPSLGYVAVTTAALAVVGAQPAITTQDLYRRVRTAATLIANGDFAGSVTGYTAAGGTLTYSTTQSRSGPGSGRFVPTGGIADGLVTSASPSDVSAGIAAGKAYTASGWIRPDTANKSMRIQVSYYTAGGAFISSQGQTIGPPIAAAWQYLEFTGDPSLVAGAARVAVAIGLTGTPAAGDAFYIDDLMIREANTDPGVRIAAGSAAGAGLADWGAAALTDYEYRAVATGANGTSIVGPWGG
jgi:hypothetical protein